MFKVIHILDDEDIKNGIKILEADDAPKIILLDIQGQHFMFSKEDAIYAMENALCE